MEKIFLNSNSNLINAITLRPRCSHSRHVEKYELFGAWYVWPMDSGCQEDPLEKEMATQISIFAWKIPRTEEPGGLQSVALQIVGHDWVTEHILSTWLLTHPHQNHLLRCFETINLRLGQWHPNPVLLPGKSHRRRSLVGCSPWGH